MSRYLQLSQKGYGHYRVTISYRGKDISCITTNMQAVDDYNSEEGEKDGRELRTLRGYKTLRNECILKNRP